MIVHGNVRNLVFKYNNKDEVVGVNLPSLRFASIGSPLLDIYGAVHSAKSGLHETSTALRGSKTFSFSRHFLVYFFSNLKSFQVFPSLNYVFYKSFQAFSYSESAFFYAF